jgi:hypothetical protein
VSALLIFFLRVWQAAEFWFLQRRWVAGWLRRKPQADAWRFRYFTKTHSPSKSVFYVGAFYGTPQDGLRWWLLLCLQCVSASVSVWHKQFHHTSTVAVESGLVAFFILLFLSDSRAPANQSQTTT